MKNSGPYIAFAQDAASILGAPPTIRGCGCSAVKIMGASDKTRGDDVKFTAQGIGRKKLLSGRRLTSSMKTGWGTRIRPYNLNYLSRIGRVPMHN